MLRDSARLLARASSDAPVPKSRSNSTCGLRSIGNGVCSSSQEMVSRYAQLQPSPQELDADSMPISSDAQANDSRPMLAAT